MAVICFRGLLRRRARPALPGIRLAGAESPECRTCPGRRAFYQAGPPGLSRRTVSGGLPMKRLAVLFFALVALLTGCGVAGTSEESGYTHISQEEAKEMMDTQEVLILDVRGAGGIRRRAYSRRGAAAGWGPSPRNPPPRSSRTRTRRSWSTAAAATAAKPPPRRWPGWGIPRSTSSAGLPPGRMRWNKKHKTGGFRLESPGYFLFDFLPDREPDESVVAVILKGIGVQLIKIQKF